MFTEMFWDGVCVCVCLPTTEFADSYTLTVTELVGNLCALSTAVIANYIRMLLLLLL